MLRLPLAKGGPNLRERNTSRSSLHPGALLMSPELKLIIVMLAALVTLYFCHLIERAVERHERRRRQEKEINDALDARTDKLFSRGMKRLTPEEIEAILNAKPEPIRMRDFRVVDRFAKGAPTRFKDDHGDVA